MWTVKTEKSKESKKEWNFLSESMTELEIIFREPDGQS